MSDSDDVNGTATPLRDVVDKTLAEVDSESMRPYLGAPLFRRLKSSADKRRFRVTMIQHGDKPATVEAEASAMAPLLDLHQQFEACGYDFVKLERIEIQQPA